MVMSAVTGQMCVGSSVDLDSRLDKHITVLRHRRQPISRATCDAIHVRAALGVGKNALRADGTGISNKINPVREFLRKTIKLC